MGGDQLRRVGVVGDAVRVEPGVQFQARGRAPRRRRCPAGPSRGPCPGSRSGTATRARSGEGHSASAVGRTWRITAFSRRRRPRCRGGRAARRAAAAAVSPALEGQSTVDHGGEPHRPAAPPPPARTARRRRRDREAGRRAAPPRRQPRAVGRDTPAVRHARPCAPCTPCAFRSRHVHRLRVPSMPADAAPGVGQSVGSNVRVWQAPEPTADLPETG